MGKFPHLANLSSTTRATTADAWAGALDRAHDFSPLLARLIDRHPDIIAALVKHDPAAALAIADPGPDVAVARRLRLARARTLLTLALADLAGESFETVTKAWSDFADWALARALDAVMGDAPGFAVIALGKHGSRELNYSSDIDPILIFDPAVLPRRPREDPGEAAVRVARRVTELMQARDGDGFVFRVDLRLRPACEATPIALPITAAIAHYESNALTWERAAFIRARAAAGDIALGQRFLEAVSPFVWRRSRDYGAISELRALTHAIRDQGGATMVGPGFDLKRGRGGIREVEFFAQIHQLIHGGRDPQLRAGATLDALVALRRAGWIDPEQAVRLGLAYRALRTIEHRLQLVDDRQTHSLPAAADLDAVARLHGLASGEQLIDWLRPHIVFVADTYDLLDGQPSALRPVESVTLAARLAAANFVDSHDAAARIARWRSGSIRAMRSPAALTAFEQLLPQLIDAMAKAAEPDLALARFDALITRLSSAVNLFRLLGARPALCELMIAILSNAPVLAEALSARPALLDRLLDHSAFDPVDSVEALTAALAVPASAATETAFDRVRYVIGESRFALGAQLIEGSGDPMVAGRGYARLAQAALVTIATRVIADFEVAHGRVPGGDLMIVALGRLGGGMLTHASDLDLVYLFTGDHAAISAGPKPLGASLYFNRLAQRLTAGLSVATSVGRLYDVDTRLRPSGFDGPLVVSVDSFDRYQSQVAWTWEHMALTRARTVFGPPAVSVTLDAMINRILTAPRHRADLAVDVVAMRAEIAVHKPAAGAFDVKLCEGGLVDLEFVVHFHQLATGLGIDPDLGVAIAALARNAAIDRALGTANALFTRLLIVMRLVQPDLNEPHGARRDLVVRACACRDWDDLLAQLNGARQDVRRHWEAVVHAAEQRDERR